MLRIPVLASFHHVCPPYCPELVPRNSSSNFSPVPLTFEANIIPECLRQLSCPPVPDFRVEVQSDPPQARHLAQLGCSEPQTVFPGCTLSAQTLVLEETNQVIMNALLNLSIKTCPPPTHTHTHTCTHTPDDIHMMQEKRQAIDLPSKGTETLHSYNESNLILHQKSR